MTEKVSRIQIVFPSQWLYHCSSIKHFLRGPKYCSRRLLWGQKPDKWQPWVSWTGPISTPSCHFPARRRRLSGGKRCGRALMWMVTGSCLSLRSPRWGCVLCSVRGKHSEYLKGIRDVLKLPEIYDSKLAIITAFNFSKSKCKTTRSHGDDYLEFNEFRFFLQTLRQFFEYYQAFSRYCSLVSSHGRKSTNI